MTRENSRPPRKKKTRVSTAKKQKKPQRTHQWNAVVEKPFTLIESNSHNQSRFAAYGRCIIITPGRNDSYTVRIEHPKAALRAIQLKPGEKIVLIRGRFRRREDHDPFSQIRASSFIPIPRVAPYPTGIIAMEDVCGHVLDVPTPGTPTARFRPRTWIVEPDRSPSTPPSGTFPSMTFRTWERRRVEPSHRLHPRRQVKN
jgi:hypothetical protein